MAGKPKTGFWVVVALVVGSLVALSLHRAGYFSLEDASVSPVTPAASSGQVLELSYYSSSAKKTWTEEMVAAFNNSGAKVGDKTIKVKVFHNTSGADLDNLKAGRIKPDIWSPGDESWLELAAAHWTNVKQKTLFDRYHPLVNIPLVVAMWEPMAKVLGHPNPIGWRDIAQAAANPAGWAALGHPEWGKFRWGHAHPDANSGFLTIISEVYAALDKTGDITAADLKKPEVVSFLEKFEGAVEHYGLSNSWIDDLMHAKGPAYLSAAVQYENTIIESNEAHQNTPFKLMAVYPKEGCFWTRHPAAILKGDWMTPEREQAAQKFIDFLLDKKAQARAMQMGLRPIRTDIPMASPFDEEHGVRNDVGAVRAFKVPEENVLRRIKDLWEEVKVPAAIVLILDRSGSMKGPPMENAKLGAIEFIRNMKPRDQLKIVVFNHNPAVLLDLCAIRDCGEGAAERLTGLFADGKTSLHDAVITQYRQLEEARRKDPFKRYCLLVLSDGKDTGSKVDRHDFLDALPRGEDFDAPKIYTIAYGSEADKDLLAEVSNRTNARLFSSSPGEIAQTYKELSANF
ncbi:MAG: VWA domain-containing protein [Pseudomonadota bacterium]